MRGCRVLRARAIARECLFDLHGGVTVAAKVWAPSSTATEPCRNVMAVHGWMDNANSFDILGESLADSGCNFVAIDLPGHGISSHRPQSMSMGYSWFDYTTAVVATLQMLEWSNFTLIGHSMGAGISTMVAGVISATDDEIGAARGASEPANRRTEVQDCLKHLSVDQCVLIEGLGPMSRPTSKTCGTLARHICARHRLLSKAQAAAAALAGDSSSSSSSSSGSHSGRINAKGARIYDTLESAVQARMKTVNLHPGRQSISYEAALAIVGRGTCPAGGISGEQEGGAVVFMHDPGILPTQPVYTDEEGVRSFLRSMADIPTLLVSAEAGWPVSPEILERKEIFQKLEHQHISDSSHHLHIDPHSAPEVVRLVRSFLDLPCVDSDSAENS